MRIIGVVPGAKLFGSEDLYADQYLFVNGYPKRISVCGGSAYPRSTRAMSPSRYCLPEEEMSS